MIAWPDFDPSWVVYRDEDLIVVDKPAHVPSQAAAEDHDDDLVTRLRGWLARERGVAPGEVYLGVHQRLDRETSGLLLFTLGPDANPGIAAQFRTRQVQKSYLALVEGGRDFEQERKLEDHLVRGPGGRMQVVDQGARGKLAVTRVRAQKRRGGRALVELGCDTGRTHQLRVQLAHAGAPIAGDRLYQGPPALRLLLHAERLRLRHPRTGAALELQARVPIELHDFLDHGARDVTSDPQLLRRALMLAREARYRLGRSRDGEDPTTAFRLFHGPAEGAPRLCVDLYGEHLIAHFFDEADPEREAQVLDALQELGCAGIYVKRHPKQKNELSSAPGHELAASGPARGSPAPDVLVVYEHGLPFEVRLDAGLRTGLFLDQRENRRRVREHAEGRRVLNLFAYTGGFSVAALAGGASEAVCVDASAAALAWAQRNTARIGAADRHRTLRGDVFEVLGRLARRGERFDLVIVDPPSYATTRRGRFRVLSDYVALGTAALAVLAPGGQLLACINHHAATQGRLRRDLRAAAQAAGRELVRLQDLKGSLDFPAAHGREPEAKSVLMTC